MKRLLQETDIERALQWTYQRQKAHLVMPTGRGLVAGLRTLGLGWQRLQATGRVLEVLELGITPDRLGRDQGALDLDAELIHTAVLHLPRHQAATVFFQALAGGRPDWGQGRHLRFVPIWKDEPKRDDQGRPRRGSFLQHYDAHRHPVLCPVRSINTLEQVADLRRTYRDWHRGLALLVGQLDGLRRLAITGPEAPAEPWAAASPRPTRLDRVATGR